MYLFYTQVQIIYEDVTVVDSLQIGLDSEIASRAWSPGYRTPVGCVVNLQGCHHSRFHTVNYENVWIRWNDIVQISFSINCCDLEPGFRLIQGNFIPRLLGRSILIKVGIFSPNELRYLTKLLWIPLDKPPRVGKL